ncbi:hypothetical protein EHI8A_001100 [Entamoeba histolytica HM-1:IMSS-B]|uniref:PUL domain-containing protein n=6 Tax=Entamoeba histolytica TaxID=5759 RepID=C4M0J8_ENTH1|nr:hypothetical protein EHI_024560 [Entamoeba histolytica HM-1:IMSS]EMD46251.1 Hypothetical protein EHI5A_011190 [Entamoeba histolytica KU27]EMH73962.1 hypothetical protein EHI8A_001100 [Entamoeba histolytica HM-1:IMSS-B]EMS11670.1 hypothetical protein KM1_011440 [Entamoeba histolytica HM-3:IMSS]ENY65375.1 hypothetical protein EHI7A_002570 [Entamoeba histolytica HM-1:IMSS-A]GAT94689.1 hypothetical protein CL6EHI_024560 [Entamoeba histolytica]|eukprot:XP_652285.1 hypothetical protein EHI_024560 [Entamoeba histolytica HM-1:IMSS]
MQIGIDENDPNILHFNVEIEGGKTCDLKYRIGDNVFTAAQDFLTQNNLPQHHLDTVAHFITENTQGFKPQTTILPALQRKKFPIKNYEKLQELLRVGCRTDNELIAIATMAQFIKSGKGFYLTIEMKTAIAILLDYALQHHEILPPLFDLFGGLCLKCLDSVKYFETISAYSQLFGVVSSMIDNGTITMPIKIMFIKFLANSFITTPPEMYMNMVYSTYGKLLPFLLNEMTLAVTNNNLNMQGAIAGVVLNLSISAINSSIAGMLADGLYELASQLYVISNDETIRAILLLSIGNFIKQDVLARNEFIKKEELITSIKASQNQNIQAIWKEINELIYGVSN